VTETALRVAGGFSMTRELPLERYFRDARGGLFQPPQDDLALGMIGRAALEAERTRAPD
jgi:alkylation response protein AidB-like acyl-CoA dehydrogenase